MKRPNDKIILVFEIKEGPKAKIRNIRFIGNKSFSSGKLRDVISSKVTRLLRFFVQDDIYNANRIEHDKYLLKRFYTEKGYINAKIVSVVAALSEDKKGFTLTFTIDEGEQYKVNEIRIKSDLKDFDTEKIKKKLYNKKGRLYNSTLVDADLGIVSREAINMTGKATKVFTTTECNHEKKTVDITIHTIEIAKVYISKIIILGNNRTRDAVIRRELPMQEGDIYTDGLASLAENRLYELGFFKNVKINIKPDPLAEGRCIMYVNVEEQSTGQATFSMQYSYLNGFGTNVAYSESNFLGTGKSLSVSITSRRRYSSKREDKQLVTSNSVASHEVSRKKRFKIFDNVTASIGSKHIFNTNIDGTFTFFSREASNFEAFDMRELGTSFGITYKLSDEFYQEFEYTIARRRMSNVYRLETPIVKECMWKKGSDNKFSIEDYKHSVLSAISHTIGYDTSFLTGLKGSFNANLQTTFAGIGGNVKHLANELTLSYAFPVFGKTTASFIAKGGVMTKIGGKLVNIADSYALGDASFRGFAVGGLGPRAKYTRGYIVQKDGKYVPIGGEYDTYIGGTKFWTITGQLAFPIGFPEEFAVRLLTSVTVGCVWDPPYTGKDLFKKGLCGLECPSDVVSKANEKLIQHEIVNSKKIRCSLTVGISLVSPMGPIALFWSFPVSKHKLDETQRFSIGISTTF